MDPGSPQSGGDRRLKTLPVQVPTFGYWREMIECQDACPVHTDARGYVRAIADGEFEQAYLIARGPNPLASICGCVCGAPCEEACRRGDLDRPVSIRALKRFACSLFGPEVRETGGRGLIDFLKEAAERHAARECVGAEDLLPLLQASVSGDVPPVRGVSVGIIGAGPAGLAAAHDLALMGFDVTIYEVEPVLAGMLAVGVPAYRLPRDLIQAEVEVITELGVRAVTGCQVGVDLSLADLRAKHDAVVIATGLKRSRLLTIPGSDAEGVLGGVEYLRSVALGDPPPLGRRVVVIGGGSVAYDVGRTTLRQISIDAARTALREHGVAEVHLCSLESLHEMPAEDLEIIEGDEEGIHRHNAVGPVEILKTADGHVSGAVFRRCTRVFDEERRFAPEYDDSVRETIECDHVLLAIGQQVDLSFLDTGGEGIERTERGLIQCDAESGRTSDPGIYVAGDLAYGPKLLIHAVASGKRVAREIYQQVTGRTLTSSDLELHLALPTYTREAGYEVLKRKHPPKCPVSERLTSQTTPVERVYDEEQAREQACRCLDCGVNTVFDGDKCILCGGCVDVCPQLCLRIVSADRLDVGRAAVPAALDLQRGEAPPEPASAILKDETICIRCALCAERCPTGAITMERFSFREVPTCAEKG